MRNTEQFHLRLPKEIMDLLNQRHAKALLRGESFSRNEQFVKWIRLGIEAEKEKGC